MRTLLVCAASLLVAACNLSGAGISRNDMAAVPDFSSLSDLSVPSAGDLAYVDLAPPADLWRKCQVVPMDTAAWVYVETPFREENWLPLPAQAGRFEKVGAALRLYPTSYRDQVYIDEGTPRAVADTNWYLKWSVSAGSAYSGIAPGVWIEGSRSVWPISGAYSTHNSYQGTVVVEENRIYYSRFNIDARGQAELVTATGNYDDEGGVIFHQASLLAMGQGRFRVVFGDAWGGTESYLQLYEARVCSP